MVDLVGGEETIHVPSVGGRNNRNVQKQVLAEIIEARFREIFEFIAQEIENRISQCDGIWCRDNRWNLHHARGRWLSFTSLKSSCKSRLPENVAGLQELIYFKICYQCCWYAMESTVIKAN